MRRVLVSALLREFATSDEPELVVDFFESAPPGGIFHGIIPTVVNRIGREEIDRLEGLRVIANYGVGYDNIDVAYARERGIAVTNTPGVLTGATAELTWALILAVARRVGEGERLVRAGGWQGWTPTQLRGMSLENKTLGIVGAGRIGREVARRAAAFGMRVLYWSRSAHADADAVGQFVELDALLGSADVVSIHLSRSSATEGIINARRLALIRDGGILVNTARGSIIDESALVRELVGGRISAGLDVYAHEPRVPQELVALENVVLLPHLGSATIEARQGMFDLAWRNLVAGITGHPVMNPVT
jgi:glyoxylate reductase